MYKYKMMDFYCDKCNRKADGVEVGTTSHEHLIAKWWCKNCRATVTALVPFEAMRAAIEPKLIAPPIWTEADRKLLAEMHIGGD